MKKIMLMSILLIGLLFLVSCSSPEELKAKSLMEQCIETCIPLPTGQVWTKHINY